MPSMALRFTTKQLLIGMAGAAVSCALWAAVPENPFLGMKLWHLPLYLLLGLAPCMTAGILLGYPRFGFTVGLLTGILSAIYVAAMQYLE
jgi:uncharacterized membrane protein